jgi:hypothetical protein
LIQSSPLTNLGPLLKLARRRLCSPSRDQIYSPKTAFIENVLAPSCKIEVRPKRIGNPTALDFLLQRGHHQIEERQKQMLALVLKSADAHTEVF